MVSRPSPGLRPGSPRSTRRHGSPRVAIAALIAVAIGAVAWWWTHPPDPETEVRSYHRPLVALERLPAPHLGRGCEQWRMIAAAGDTMTGLWRAGAPRRGSEWVVVILGGIGTDDRAALLV